jgi:CubicO group peptidase (beta-lactamase class C family)
MSTRAHAVVRRGLHYGFGWWIRSGSYAGYGYLGQVLAVFPGRDEVVLVTSSRENADPLALVRRLTRG